MTAQESLSSLGPPVPELPVADAVRLAHRSPLCRRPLRQLRHQLPVAAFRRPRPCANAHSRLHLVAEPQHGEAHA